MRIWSGKLMQLAAIAAVGLIGLACPAYAAEGDLVAGEIGANDAAVEEISANDAAVEEIGANDAVAGEAGADNAAAEENPSTADGEGGTAVDTATASGDDAEYAPMHRLYNPYTGEHFYTGFESERDSLSLAGWTYEGESWRAPLQSDVPVYRLYNQNSGDHHYTMSADERDSLVTAGWSDEGVAWYSDGDEGVPLYRLFNPLAATGTHHYTSSIAERTDLVSRGWMAEDVGWYGCAFEGEDASDIGDDPATADGEEAVYAPIYRLYCPATGDHVYTASKGERNDLASWVWHYEGACWQSPSAGDPVYRLSNPHSDEHVYTASAEESGALVRAGWNYEGTEFYSCGDADEDRVPMRRLYNPNSGLHHFTTSADEQGALVDAGWRDEGVVWYAHLLDEGFEDDLDLWQPRISGDAGFDIQVECMLYYLRDLRAAFDYVAGFPYRSGNRFFSGPRLLDDGTTKDMAQDMIANHSGNCYRFASLFCWLARGLGYSANVVSGWVPTYSSGHDPHGWTEVYIDGQTYIYDPDMVQFHRNVNWFMRTYDSPPTNYGSW